VVSLATAIKGLTGVVEHGLFLAHAQSALLGSPDGTLERLVRS
jgi:ribose 5-phosphate isomerase